MTRQVPWLRVFVESVVIVGSILLAFGIEASWDEWGAREREADVYRAVSRELRNNSRYLDQNATFHQEQLARISVLLDIAARGGSGIDPDSLDNLLAGLSRRTISSYERGALDAALLGGGVDVIINFSVKERLAQWERALDRLSEVEENEAYIVRDLWLPRMRRSSYLPQISNTGSARIADWDSAEIPTDGAKDHSDLLRDKELVNVLVQRQWVHEEILRVQSGVQALLRGLLIQLTPGLGSRVVGAA